MSLLDPNPGAPGSAIEPDGMLIDGLAPGGGIDLVTWVLLGVLVLLVVEWGLYRTGRMP